MLIRQTISELGLEQGTIAAWPEPLAAKLLKPKHGKSPFPWKLVFSFLMVLSAAFFFASAAKINEKSVLLFAVILVIVSLSLPILKLLDRKVVRNVWIYPDRVLITHKSDRVSIEKSTLSKMYTYSTPCSSGKAIEFVLRSGVSYVVGLPRDLVISELTFALENSGYTISK